MVKESIIQLVRNCLNLSHSSNEHEAAAAASKAQELLFKYNLSISEVEITDGSDKKAANPITRGMEKISGDKNDSKWRSYLLHGIARYNFCDMITYGRDQAVIIGQEHNIEVVKELYRWLVEQIINASGDACRNYRGPDRIPTFRRAFNMGAANEVRNRLYRMWAELQQKTVSSTALVVRNDQAITEYKTEHFPELRKGRGSHTSSTDGYIAGRQAGKQMDLVAKRKLSSGSTRMIGGGN